MPERLEHQQPGRLRPAKAFIFDLDGVLINNEPAWEHAKKAIFTGLFDQEVYEQMGSTVGLSLDATHARTVALGGKKTKEDIHEAYREHAPTIYGETPITPGIQKLGEELVQRDYRIGIVSASPLDWMKLVIARLNFRDDIGVVISLEERTDLEHKPSPDGYSEAINSLQAIPASTLILEDSNAGIAAGKAAGAFVIGLQQNLLEGYVQHGADVYVAHVDEVTKYLDD
jgi:HAD superfamily hydrolase (TIGR01509 family)